MKNRILLNKVGCRRNTHELYDEIERNDVSSAACFD